MISEMRLSFAPLTLDRWRDLETLFGARGACAGCWCMYPRLSRSAWEAGRGAANKRALRRLVAAGPPPGILAYRGETPIGWCAIAPRGSYPLLARSRVLAPVDDSPVASIACLFVAKAERKRGVSKQLLRAAAAFARSWGARLVEGYPTDKQGSQPDAFLWTGLASAFLSAGFAEVARRSRTRPIMRRSLRPKR